jgi:hypothetical protein
MNIKRRKTLSKIKRRSSAAPRGSRDLLLNRAINAGWKAGSIAQAEKKDSKHFYESRFQQSFVEWMNANIYPRPEYNRMKRLSEAFCQGYANASGRRERGIPLLLQGSAAAVVCASSEEEHIHAMLNELERLPLQEIIVVLNGCRDNSYALSRSHRLVTVVYYPQRLGHDVGRSIGARLVGADNVLFCDGDLVIPAEDLAPFLYAVDGDCDVALNDLNKHLPMFARQDEVTCCKSFLNMVLGRSDLGANSMTAVPHALSGRLFKELNPKHLTVPPKAQAMAILGGYRVKAVHAVDVFSRNRKRRDNTGRGNAVARMIIGDHAEALQEIFERYGDFGPAGYISRKDVAMRRNTI